MFRKRSNSQRPSRSKLSTSSFEARCANQNGMLRKQFLETYKHLSRVVNRIVGSIEAQRRRQQKRASLKPIERKNLVFPEDDVIEQYEKLFRPMYSNVNNYEH